MQWMFKGKSTRSHRAHSFGGHQHGRIHGKNTAANTRRCGQRVGYLQGSALASKAPKLIQLDGDKSKKIESAQHIIKF
jgi:hypothetical protein